MTLQSWAGTHGPSRLTMDTAEEILQALNGQPDQSTIDLSERLDRPRHQIQIGLRFLQDEEVVSRFGTWQGRGLGGKHGGGIHFTYSLRANRCPLCRQTMPEVE